MKWNNVTKAKLYPSEYVYFQAIEQCTIDINAGKQQSWAATAVKVTLVLKKWTTFKKILELRPSDVSK